MADRAKLLAELTGPRAADYNAAIQNGSNSTLMDLLNNRFHATAKQGLILDSQVVLNAVAPVLKDLTAIQLQRLQVVLASGTVNAGDADTVLELRDIFAGKTAVLQRLNTIASRAKTLAEEHCDGHVTLEDLWAVLPQIPASLHARYLAGG